MKDENLKNHEHRLQEHNKHSDTKEDGQKEAKEHVVDSKKSLVYVVVIIVVIIALLFSILFFTKYINNTKNSISYNHYVFQRFEGDKWMTQQLIKGQLYDIPFYNNPYDVLNIPVDNRSIALVRSFSFNPNGTVYITIEPNEQSKIVLAGVEYARLLGSAYDIYDMSVKSAIASPIANENASKYPLITCKDASKDTLVIYQVVTDKNLISTNGNCIILESMNLNESVKVADAFAFRLLDIIQ